MNDSPGTGAPHTAAMEDHETQQNRGGDDCHGNRRRLSGAACMYSSGMGIPLSRPGWPSRSASHCPRPQASGVKRMARDGWVNVDDHKEIHLTPSRAGHGQLGAAPPLSD